MNSRMKMVGCVLFLHIILCCDGFSGTFEPDWFPRQKYPESVVKVNIDDGFNANHMLVQSISGLAAMAVNEGRFDEMVWIEYVSPDCQRWYNDAINRLECKESGECTPWQLVKRYQDKGVYEGYILYRYPVNFLVSDGDNVQWMVTNFFFFMKIFI